MVEFIPVKAEEKTCPYKTSETCHLKDVLAIVAHELKNPLNTIKGFNEIISEELKNEIKAAEIISKSISQMEHLIGDLLDFAKIESGTFAIQFRPCLLQQLISDEIVSMEQQAKEKGIQITSSLDNALIIECDPNRIRQVISNLLRNAIKFSPKHGQVIVQARSADLFVFISVKDNGSGIPTEQIQYIFDKYWQSRDTTQFGYGLGLAISKRIIEGHGGQIWVESEVGHGTTFHVRLPISQNLKEQKSLPHFNYS